MKFIVPPSLGGPRARARAELLESSLSNELRREVEVRAAETYAELRDAVLTPSVELAWCPAAILAELSEARAVLRSVRAGHDRYHSALIVREGRGVTLSTLQGKRAAWVDPLSVGGYLLALSWLRAKGIEPKLMFASEDFLGSHRAVVEALLDDTHDVAAISTPGADEAEVRRALEFHAGGAADRLAVLGVTDSAPTDALVITTKLSETEADRITQCLVPRKSGRIPSFLLTAMEVDRLERSTLDDYRALRRFVPRKSELPPPRR